MGVEQEKVVRVWLSCDLCYAEFPERGSFGGTPEAVREGIRSGWRVTSRRDVYCPGCRDSATT